MRFTEKQVFDCWQRAQLKTDPGTKDTIDCLTDELNLLLDEWLKALEKENEQLREEMISRKTLAAIMEPTANDIREANEWVNRILTYEKNYQFPASNNFSYEEAERITLAFFAESRIRAKELGHDIEPLTQPRKEKGE